MSSDPFSSSPCGPQPDSSLVRSESSESPPVSRNRSQGDKSNEDTPQHLQDDFGDFFDFVDSTSITESLSTLTARAKDRRIRQCILAELLAPPPYPVGLVFEKRHQQRIKRDAAAYSENFDEVLEAVVESHPLPPDWRERSTFFKRIPTAQSGHAMSQASNEKSKIIIANTSALNHLAKMSAKAPTFTSLPRAQSVDTNMQQSMPFRQQVIQPAWISSTMRLVPGSQMSSWRNHEQLSNRVPPRPANSTGTMGPPRARPSKAIPIVPPPSTSPSLPSTMQSKVARLHTNTPADKMTPKPATLVISTKPMQELIEKVCGRSPDPLKLTSSPEAISAIEATVTEVLSKDNSRTVPPASANTVKISSTDEAISTAKKSTGRRRCDIDESSDSEPEPLLSCGGETVKHEGLADRQRASQLISAPDRGREASESIKSRPSGETITGVWKQEIFSPVTGRPKFVPLKKSRRGYSDRSEKKMVSMHRRSDSGRTSASTTLPVLENKDKIRKKLFAIQIRDGDQTCSHDVFEDDDPELLARELRVKYKDLIHDAADWELKIQQMFQKKLAKSRNSQKS